MKNKLVEKTYTAIVSGVPQTEKGCIQYPVAHHYKNKKKMIVITRGKKIQYKGKPQPAETCWKLIKKNSSLACLQIRIYQGKRHQIRVHLAAIGHPIIGDKLYYSGPIESPYHLLYASQIKFKDMQNRPQVISVEVPFLKQYFID
jgi:23S rRNA pseudouridine1911/1915/1917 synthase